MNDDKSNVSIVPFLTVPPVILAMMLINDGFQLAIIFESTDSAWARFFRLAPLAIIFGSTVSAWAGSLDSVLVSLFISAVLLGFSLVVGFSVAIVGWGIARGNVSIVPFLTMPPVILAMMLVNEGFQFAITFASIFVSPDSAYAWSTSFIYSAVLVGFSLVVGFSVAIVGWGIARWGIARGNVSIVLFLTMPLVILAMMIGSYFVFASFIVGLTYPDSTLARIFILAVAFGFSLAVGFTVAIIGWGIACGMNRR